VILRVTWLILALVLAPGLGGADERTATLEFDDSSGAADCPDGPALRDAVAARLGYVPFRAQAPLRVVVRITGAHRRLVGTVDAQDDQGREIHRELSSAAGDCAQLVETMSLVISLTIDPLAVGQPQPPEAPALPAPPALPTPATPPGATTPPSPTAVPRGPSPPITQQTLATRARRRRSARRRPVLLVGVGGLAAVGAAPSPTAGALVTGGVRLGIVSVSLEGRLDTSGEASRPTGGRVRGSVRQASLVPCLHAGIVAGCGALSAGEMWGRGQDVDTPRSASTFYATLGARAGLELAPLANLRVGLRVEVAVPLTPTELRLDDQRVWRSPAAAFALGAVAQGAFEL
jgi:hypothetical protein